MTGPGRGADAAPGELDLVTLTDAPEHQRLLEAFYRGLYWDAFAAQREPLEVWLRALAGELPYRQTIRIALAGGAIVGGITYELYPRSRCGFATYGVVAPGARRRGLGRLLLDGAVADLYAAGARLVFGEVEDPRPPRAPDPGLPAAWERVLRYQRWGWRALDARYVQPALGPGLARDRGLVLLACPPGAAPPDALDGELARAFVTELYEITEGGPPDAEIAFPDRVPLIELRPA